MLIFSENAYLCDAVEPGKWADFIIVDGDYFTSPSDQIDDIQVLETWIGGERVYRRD